MVHWPLIPDPEHLMTVVAYTFMNREISHISAK